MKPDSRQGKAELIPASPVSVGNNGRNNIRTVDGKLLGGITGKGFMPGKSGNPDGRPRKLSKAYREILDQPYPGDPEGRDYATVIAERLGKAAAKGDTGAARELADRTEGKARQPVELSAPSNLDDLAEEELDQRILELERKNLASDPAYRAAVRRLLAETSPPAELGPLAEPPKGRGEEDAT